MKIRQTFLFVLFIFCMHQASAHVVLTYPEGGEKFYSNDTVKISWQIAQYHDQIGWNLYYSPDGGENWSPIVSGIPVSQLEFKWVVPVEETSAGRILVVQDNNGQNYDDVSANFTIEHVSSTKETISDLHLFESFSIRPNPVQSAAHLSFDLAKPETLSICIYSIDAGLVYEITERAYNQGAQQIPLNNLFLNPGIYFVTVRTITSSRTYKLLKVF